MAKKEHVIIAIDSSFYENADYFKLSRREKIAAISAVTHSIEANIQAWFEQNGYQAQPGQASAVFLSTVHRRLLLLLNRPLPIMEFPVLPK